MLKTLNDKQQEAVLHDQGPLLILAGAGSGKTKALTHRLAYLVKKRRISPLNILCLTFTNKAAAEMAGRVSQLLGSSQHAANSWQPKAGSWKLPWLGTFHSVCAKILRREIIHLNQGFSSNFTIFDEDDSTGLIKKIMVEINLDPKKFSPEAIKSYISRAKNELISPLKYRNLTDSIFTETVAKIYPLYEKKLKELNALDFDNLINKLIELLQKEPRVLERYQRLFKYILVDEYQDTNHSQYLLLKLLAQKEQNICVVGDDWQSIYRFRGADFRNILEFKRDYFKAKIIKLEENYRSTGNILQAAQSVIKNNELRSDKNLYSVLGPGEKVKLVQARNQEGEGEFIIQTIKEIKEKEDSKLNQSVVLYRTNAQSRALEETMLRYGIPYRIIGGVRFYQRKEIKDVLAYLKIIHNPKDTNSLLRIINTPARGISQRIINSLNSSNILTTKKNQSKFPAIKKFLLLIKNLKKDSRRLNIFKFILILLKKTGYKDYLLDGSEEGEQRFENIKELFSVAKKYSHLKPQESLQNFLEEVALLSDIDSLDEKSDALTLMTLHNAKGLEFDNVFMAGFEEDFLPHSRSQLEPEELEEERRLCYVGMTRAKIRLYLIFSQERLIWGRIQSNPPSRFLDEIDQSLVEIFPLDLYS
ncbi:UvrD-helicase domain-containing protein [Patescibacteria group bacterium]|nr:UvrD-helicase domain-containing protein [Patescibacteria group bacterium]